MQYVAGEDLNAATSNRLMTLQTLPTADCCFIILYYIHYNSISIFKIIIVGKF